MTVLPPGTLLQLMYLRERLASINPGHFIEIGPGSGEITQLLLDLGWTGLSFDLENVTIERLCRRFEAEISQGRYSPVNADYLSISGNEYNADLVISCMVMEHLDDDLESAFVQKSAEVLKPEGRMIALVPGSPAHWGIEDDIAGHCRRYTFDVVQKLMGKNLWKVEHVAGLTYPVSNWLLPISNFLVNQQEKSKLSLSALEKTKLSGRRNVKFKTHFPSFLALILNQYMLWPFHFLQKIFKKSQHALVIYFEAKPQT